MATISIVTGSGVRANVSSVADAMSYLKSGSSVIRPDGSLASIFWGANRDDATRVLIDGVPLTTILLAPAVVPTPIITPPVTHHPPGIPVDGEWQKQPGGVRSSDGRVYRLIFQTAPGRVDTGATYPQCARDNSQGCIPMQFGSIQAAFDYAESVSEIPILVGSADEAWDIVEGKQPVGGGLSTGAMVAVGALALMLLRRRR